MIQCGCLDSVRKSWLCKRYNMITDRHMHSCAYVLLYGDTMLKKLEKTLEMLGAAMIAMLFATVIIQVAARVIFSIPATWTVEVGRAFFLAIVFLLAPVVLLNNSLMMINSLHDLTKGKARFALDFINDLFIDFILVTLSLGSYERTLETWNVEIPTVEWMKSGYLYLVMLIGTLLMLAFSLYNTFSRLKKGL